MISNRTDRVANIVVGDFSNDGHGRYTVHAIRLQGKDVCDEALRRSYAEAVRTVGFSPYDLFVEYENNTVSLDQWNALRPIWESGADARTTAEVSAESQHIDVGEVFNTPSTPDHEFPTEYALSLVMAYVGYKIDDFAWDVVHVGRNLIGGWSPLLNDHGSDRSGEMFGYGLFF